MRYANIKSKAVTHVYRAGCGTRRVGSTYLVTNTGTLAERVPEAYRGNPWTFFMQDPPVAIYEPADLGLCAQGISYQEIETPTGKIWMANDWIGSEHYKNAADYWEELSNGYASGLVPLQGDGIAHLIPGHSMRRLFHSEGYFGNPAPLREAFIHEVDMGPCVLPPSHELYPYHTTDPQLMCAALWWQHVRGTNVLGGATRLGTRTIGEASYQAAKPPSGVDCQPMLAWIGSIPIDELHLVMGDNPKEEPPEVQTKIAKALKALAALTGKNQLPVFVTNA